MYKEVIHNLYNTQYVTKDEGRNETLLKIEELNKKISKGRELLLKGDLDGNDYRLIKIECEAKINILETKLTEYPKKKENIDSILNKAVDMLTNLYSLYQNGDIQLKREIIGSMYPEKLTFDGTQHRTTKLNEVASIMYQIYSELGIKKRRASDDFSCLPTWVRPDGLEPSTKRL